MKNQELESYVKKLIHDALKRELPHTCFTCLHFGFNKVDGVEQENKGNRYCQHPGNLEVKAGVCQMWSLQPDPRKRKPSFVSYYPKKK